ncbi:thiolase family protein [Parageobacillus toebii]|uniref:thiolase family protein n=1 Tax=Parageobacillus toebii TaxID=153151 RepID=UPI0019676157|nr:thiolase family protein [Parageobacillus toebii]QSB49934.1 thiolase family protein [Parageobacillus toebii]
MQKVVVLGVGMTRFGKYLDRSLKELAREALQRALTDAGISLSKIEAAYVGNAVAGIITGQECIRGQVMLSGTGLEGIPIFNVENACASGSSAFHMAWMSVASGMYDVVLALGAEKMIHPERTRAFQALKGAADVEELEKFPGGGADRDNQSLFMDYYAIEARKHMEQYGTSIETFAKIAVKNSRNGSLNPNAQYQKQQTLEDVMGSRIISDPLRLLMCSPLSDGAAATILCSEKISRQLTNDPVFVASSVVYSSNPSGDVGPSNTERAAAKAYALAGIEPSDVQVAEVHDAAAPGELWAYEHLGLCAPGDGARLVESGATEIGGRIPVNPSGGLIAKGHPVGATGIAQIAEIVWQLRGQAGKRQIPGQAKVGLTHNAGGFLNGGSAAVAIHILTR